MPKTQELESGILFADRYIIERLLGKGGMGQVYLAKDTVLENESVALKILLSELSTDEKHAKRFLREVQLTRQVTFANVVRTYEVNKHKDQYYFTMEYVEGKALTEFLEEKYLSAYETSLILLQLCRGLSAIHEQGIIHRDLKPSNIMLTKDAVVKIADFGIARPSVSNQTICEEIVGSAPYMAPEIWAGRDICAQTDIYALGVLAYELLTGVWPLDGDNQSEIMFKHYEVSPVAPSFLVSDIPTWLDKLILKMLQKKIEDRPRSALDVAKVIEDNLEYLRKQMSNDSSNEDSESLYSPTWEPPDFDSSLMETIENSIPASLAIENIHSASQAILQTRSSMHVVEPLISQVIIADSEKNQSMFLRNLMQVLLWLLFVSVLSLVLSYDVAPFIKSQWLAVNPGKSFNILVIGISSPLILMCVILGLAFSVLPTKAFSFANSLKTSISQAINILIVAGLLICSQVTYVWFKSHSSESVIRASLFQSTTERGVKDAFHIAALIPGNSLQNISNDNANELYTPPDFDPLFRIASYFLIFTGYIYLLIATTRRYVLSSPVLFDKKDKFLALAATTVFFLEHNLILKLREDYSFSSGIISFQAFGPFVIDLQIISIGLAVFNWLVFVSVTYILFYLGDLEEFAE